MKTETHEGRKAAGGGAGEASAAAAQAAAQSSTSKCPCRLHWQPFDAIAQTLLARRRCESMRSATAPVHRSTIWPAGGVEGAERLISQQAAAAERHANQQARSATLHNLACTPTHSSGSGMLVETAWHGITGSVISLVLRAASWPAGRHRRRSEEHSQAPEPQPQPWCGDAARPRPRHNSTHRAALHAITHCRRAALEAPTEPPSSTQKDDFTHCP